MADFRTLKSYLLIFVFLAIIIPVSIVFSDISPINRIQGDAIVGTPVNWTLQIGTYKINYETPAPQKIEEDLGTRKIITVSSNSSEHYTRIKSFSSLPEISYTPKIYHVINGEKLKINNLEEYEVTFLDTTFTGKYDRVEWIIPQLSVQIFEIELLVLNIQSYPIVEDNWTVMFNTTGTADLTIQATSGTTWSNSEDTEDLKFLELKCEGSEVPYEWRNNSVFVENYSCDGKTSFETSEVLTLGSHHIKFQFGDLIKYSHNFASGGYCNVIFSDPVQEFIDSNGQDILAVDSNGNLFIGSLSFTDETIPTLKTNGINLYGSGLKWAFNKVAAQISGHIIEETTLPQILNSDNDIVIRNSSFNSNVSLIYFQASTGNILVLGKAVYNGSQAGCPSDINRCNYLSGNIQTSDNWCNTSANPPSCTTTWGATTEDCNVCLGEYNPSNLNYTIVETVTDKHLCEDVELTECEYTNYTDFCEDYVFFRKYYCTFEGGINSVTSLADRCARIGQGWGCDFDGEHNNACFDCDADNDGQCPSPHGPDCCDSNNNVYNGQTQCFTSPYNCGSGNTFDYDCDGSSVPCRNLNTCNNVDCSLFEDSLWGSCLPNVPLCSDPLGCVAPEQPINCGLNTFVISYTKACCVTVDTAPPPLVENHCLPNTQIFEGSYMQLDCR